MARQLWLFIILAALNAPMKGQTFMEIGNIYPISAADEKQVITGFMPFEGFTDEIIFTNALLWTIENICPQLREGITQIDIPTKKFACEFTLTSRDNNSKQNNIYYGKASFRIADGKLIYYLSDILIESSVFVMKKVTPLERLNPEKKTSHKQTIDDFLQVESMMLNNLFDYIKTNKTASITHWNDIAIRRPVEGMNQDECRLAFGKPISILETNGETQWMYSSSFYLFFKNGIVQTIIK